MNLALTQTLCHTLTTVERLQQGNKTIKAQLDLVESCHKSSNQPVCRLYTHQWLALDLSHGRSLRTLHTLPQPRSLECGKKEREETFYGALLLVSTAEGISYSASCKGRYPCHIGSAMKVSILLMSGRWQIYQYKSTSAFNDHSKLLRQTSLNLLSNAFLNLNPNDVSWPYLISRNKLNSNMLFSRRRNIYLADYLGVSQNFCRPGPFSTAENHRRESWGHV